MLSGGTPGTGRTNERIGETPSQFKGGVGKKGKSQNEKMPADGARDAFRARLVSLVRLHIHPGVFRDAF